MKPPAKPKSHVNRNSPTSKPSMPSMPSMPSPEEGGSTHPSLRSLEEALDRLEEKTADLKAFADKYKPKRSVKKKAKTSKRTTKTKKSLAGGKSSTKKKKTAPAAPKEDAKGHATREKGSVKKKGAKGAKGVTKGAKRVAKGAKGVAKGSRRSKMSSAEMDRIMRETIEEEIAKHNDEMAVKGKEIEAKEDEEGIDMKVTDGANIVLDIMAEDGRREYGTRNSAGICLCDTHACSS